MFRNITVMYGGSEGQNTTTDDISHKRDFKKQYFFGEMLCFDSHGHRRHGLEINSHSELLYLLLLSHLFTDQKSC